MIIALTGTPGTGKTTVCDILSNRYGEQYHIIDLNNLIISEGLHFGKDERRDSYAADIEMLGERVERIIDRTSEARDIIMEGHLSHLLPADAVIVLRAEPVELKKRLGKRKSYSVEKVKENAEAEALDVILVEAVEICQDVYEIDTTGRDPQDVAGSVVRIIVSLKEGRAPQDFLPGKINWLDQVEIR